jgi:hypothetical protein
MTHDHWAGENCLHWVMDMIFRDDECSVRTENTSASSRLKPSPDSPGYCPLNFLSMAALAMRRIISELDKLWLCEGSRLIRGRQLTLASRRM